jgi:hypothetical protein
VFFRLNELWRVGYRDDPLSTSVEYQGNGRFDDPQRERAVLYGSDTVETCIIEIAMPWNLHADASYVQQKEAPERDGYDRAEMADNPQAAPQPTSTPPASAIPTQTPRLDNIVEGAVPTTIRSRP